MKCLEACINFQFGCSQTISDLGYTLMSSYKRSPKYRALEPLHTQWASGSYWALFAQPAQAHVSSSYCQFMSKLADEAPAIMSLKLAESRRNWGWPKHTQLSTPTSRNILGSSNQYHPLSSHWPNTRNVSFVDILQTWGHSIIWEKGNSGLWKDNPQVTELPMHLISVRPFKPLQHAGHGRLGWSFRRARCCNQGYVTKEQEDDSLWIGNQQFTHQRPCS